MSSDTIISSYRLEAKNFLDGIKFKEYFGYLGDVLYSTMGVEYHCHNEITMFPELLEKRKMYYLINTKEISLPRDTRIIWTLVYTDQYGRV